MEFFNDLSKRFSNVAKSVTEKTKDGVEVTRIASDLRIQKNALEQLYAELGKACYAMRIGEGDAEQAEQLSARIERTRARIDELVAQRDAIRDVRRCPSCGQVMVKDARFCSNCGKRMPEEAPQVAEDPAEAEYCPDCGAQRGANDRFCAVCGRSFEPGAALKPEAAPEPEASARFYDPEPEDIEEPEVYGDEAIGSDPTPDDWN